MGRARSGAPWTTAFVQNVNVSWRRLPMLNDNDLFSHGTEGRRRTALDRRGAVTAASRCAGIHRRCSRREPASHRRTNMQFDHRPTTAF